MGYAMLGNFDTIEEAELYKAQKVKEGFEEERLIIFDDKEFPDLGKRYSVNYD